MEAIIKWWDDILWDAARIRGKLLLAQYDNGEDERDYRLHILVRGSHSPCHAGYWW